MKFHYVAISEYSECDEKEAVEAIREALRNGVNYIDTAYWYGQGTSERILGKALEGVPRSAYYMATKVGRYELAAGGRFDFSATKTRASVENSLKLLQLDYVDVIQIHDIEFAPNLEIVINETLPTLEALVREGRAKFIGVTGYALSTLRECIERAPGRFDMVLTYARYTMIDDSLCEYMDFFKANHLGIICASGFSMGLLTNQGPQDWHPATPEIKAACTQARDICKAKGIELARLAIDYCMKLPGVATFLFGMQSREMVVCNLKVYLNGLTPDEKDMQSYLVENVFAKIHPKHWEGVEVACYWKQLKNGE